VGRARVPAALRRPIRTVQAERAVRLAGQATPAEQAFAAAVLVRETDRSAEAARQASELAGRYPDSWLAAWLAFDVALFKQRDLSAAERALRAGLARHPDHNLLQNVLGYTLRGQGRNEEAHAVFERNAAAHPDQPNPGIRWRTATTRSADWTTRSAPGSARSAPTRRFASSAPFGRSSTASATGT
jgi:predicted Zn-dependent protease